MITSHSRETYNKQVYEQAAEWLVELRSGDTDCAARERLDRWFRESPHHIRAFLELSSIWEEGDDPGLNRDWTSDELIAHARDTTNVIALQTADCQGRNTADTSRRVRSPSGAGFALARVFRWRPMLLASIVVVCLSLALLTVQGFLNPTYATGTGEQRTVRLQDGSQVMLNSSSRVRVRYSSTVREVDLIEGQVFCNVAKDSARPFIVRSGSTQVRAVGTQFDVYRRESGLVVTVVEGRVGVLPIADGELTARESTSQEMGPAQKTIATVLVSAGEQVTATTVAITPPAHADVATATAWRRQEIVFDFTPLPEVAREFNRYNDRKLLVADPRLDEFHITGVFSSTDSASLLHFLRAQPSIAVEETDEDIRILKK